MPFFVNETGAWDLGCEIRGRRHFNQAHRKTSLFGSENEEQIDYSTNVNNQHQSARTTTGDKFISNEIPEIMNTRNSKHQPAPSEEKLFTEDKSSKYDSNANNAGTEIDLLIEAAKARAQRRELAKVERDAMEDESLIRTGKRRTETYAALQAPWHTDFNDKSDMNQVNGRVKKLSSKVMELKQKTTSQADFPEYSTQELKESKLPPRRAEYKESVPWYPGSNGIKVTNDQQSHYKRSSDVIGEGLVDTLEGACRRQKTFKEKVAAVAPVAASSLRSTPYAQHN